MEVDSSSPVFLATLSFCLLGFFLWSRCTRKRREAIPLPPGPRKWPLIGNLHLFVRGQVHRTLRDLADTHGPLILVRLGQVDFVVASSTEGAEEILKHQDLNFAFRPKMLLGKILGYGDRDVVFAPYGDYWKQTRKICNMQLMSNKRVNSFFPIREEAVLRMMKQILVAVNCQAPVALYEILSSTVNFIVMKSAFGDKAVRVNSNFLYLVKEVEDVLNSLVIEDIFPSLKFLDVITGLRFKVERIHRQFDNMVNEIIAQHQADSDNTTKGTEDLLDVLLRLKDHGGDEFSITPATIRGIILDIFFAGSETSTAVIEWAMAEMIKSPKVMEKAQHEVREALRGRNRIEESDIKDLHYLRLVIKETLRFHTVAPLLMARECKETCQVLGHTVPTGTRVFINAWALARDKRYWGPNAESFDPERFVNSSIDYKGFNYEYLPFGSGKRVCPGITFGVASVEVILANLLFYFDWQLPGGMKPEELSMEERTGIASSKRLPLSLFAIPRIPLPTVELAT